MTNPEGTRTLEEDNLFNIKERERRLEIKKQTKENRRQEKYGNRRKKD